jgi:hypothetical protein
MGLRIVRMLLRRRDLVDIKGDICSVKMCDLDQVKYEISDKFYSSFANFTL